MRICLATLISSATALRMPTAPRCRAPTMAAAGEPPHVAVVQERLAGRPKVRERVEQLRRRQFDEGARPLAVERLSQFPLACAGTKRRGEERARS